jgi:hypothetical protein
MTFTCAARRRLRSKVGSLRRDDNLVPGAIVAGIMHVSNVTDRDRALLRVLYQVRTDGRGWVRRQANRPSCRPRALAAMLPRSPRRAGRYSRSCTRGAE